MKRASRIPRKASPGRISRRVTLRPNDQGKPELVSETTTRHCGDLLPQNVIVSLRPGSVDDTVQALTHEDDTND